MALEGDSYCRRHPDVEAVGRCRQCGVPFCADCKVAAQEGEYCSMECRAQHKRFINRSDEIGNPRQGGLIKKFVTLLLIATGVGAAAHFLGLEVPVVSDLIRKFR